MDMHRVRDRVYRLLDKRPWKRQMNDLYFLLSCLNGMMGGTAGSGGQQAGIHL
jgi:hypothetical protein